MNIKKSIVFVVSFIIIFHSFLAQAAAFSARDVRYRPITAGHADLILLIMKDDIGALNIIISKSKGWVTEIMNAHDVNALTMRKGSNLNFVPADMRLLGFAVLSNKIKAVEAILKKYPDQLNEPLFRNGVTTPLIWAAASGHLQIVKLLLKLGARTDIIYNGKDAHQLALDREDFEMAQEISKCIKNNHSSGAVVRDNIDGNEEAFDFSEPEEKQQPKKKNQKNKKKKKEAQVETPRAVDPHEADELKQPAQLQVEAKKQNTADQRAREKAEEKHAKNLARQAKKKLEKEEQLAAQHQIELLKQQAEQQEKHADQQARQEAIEEALARAKAQEEEQQRAAHYEAKLSYFTLIQLPKVFHFPNPCFLEREAFIDKIAYYGSGFHREGIIKALRELSSESKSEALIEIREKVYTLEDVIKLLQS